MNGCTFFRAAFTTSHSREAEVNAIAGTAGKTATGLLGWIFEQAGLNPTVYCGGALLNWKSSDKLVVHAQKPPTLDYRSR